MKTNKLKQFKASMIVYVVYLLSLVIFASVIPADAQVPTHWNFKGEIDDYSGKWSAILFGFIFNTILLLIMMFFSSIQPKYKKNEDRYDKLLPQMSCGLLGFLGLIHLYSLVLALYQIESNQFSMIILIIGLLFIFIGNLMSKTPRNYFIGIKTPWTLASEEVWFRTHRIGGRMFLLAGVLMIAKSIFLEQEIYQLVLTIIAFALLLYPILYSFIIFKKLEKENKS